MKNKIIVISSYPQKNEIHGSKTVGGASYTKNLLIKTKRKLPELAISVYAEKFGGHEESYMENGITVNRIWKRNNPLSVSKAFSEIRKEKTKDIVVSYEINMVGGAISNLMLFFELYLLKVSGRNIYLIPHQVPGDFSELEKNSLKAFSMNLLKNTLFHLFSMISTKIALFEKKFGDFLPDRSKTRVVPLAIDQNRKTANNGIRRKLGLKKKDFNILFFGFISPYKGIDRFLNIYKKSWGKLIIAGDANPNHIRNKNYMEFVNGVKKKAIKKKAVLTGFVKEEDIAGYFAAADLVILPYKMFISSSYPMSLAFSYDKPVLFSRHLSEYFENHDFITAAKKSGLKTDDFLFEFSEKSFGKKIANLKKNKSQFIEFAKSVKSQRSWNKVIDKFIKFLEII